ncbi:MAG: leucine-rich repeat domain-containing protein [Clostridiales bacterium]|nr:leucine-rich repeat domain-containing protein [Clostridiales bacterium]
MPTWKKVTFVVVLTAFIGLSVFFTFYSIARDTFEFEERTNVGEIEGLNGWVFYGFCGNPSTKTVNIDFATDKKGENADRSKPVVGVDDFTIVSDEYVEYIHIGKDVRFISEQAFYYCKQLKAVTVDEGNEYFCSVNGCLYSKDKSVLLLRPIKNGDWLVENGLAQTNDTFAIPEGVERIAGWSFYKNTELVHLTFPSTVREIGDMAFFGCNNLWSIWLNEGLQKIGKDAFSYCWCMSPIMYIPSTVTEIGDNAFFSCSALSIFYMGASGDENIQQGSDWLPKSIKGGIVNKAPEPVYGKTLEDALAEKDRIDAENAAKEAGK